MQHVTQNRNAYKRAALLLLVLPIRIDSRRNTPTPYTLSSVPYRPRIPTPCKDNQRATHTPQIFAPLQARRCTSFPACYPACYPARIPPTPQRLHGLPWEGSQPTRIPSADACNQRRQRFNRKTLPLHLTHSPTIRQRKASRNASSKSARLGRISRRNSRQLGNAFPIFLPDICGRSRPRAPEFLRAAIQRAYGLQIPRRNALIFSRQSNMYRFAAIQACIPGTSCIIDCSAENRRASS